MKKNTTRLKLLEEELEIKSSIIDDENNSVVNNLKPLKSDIIADFFFENNVSNVNTKYILYSKIKN
jgi:hypothetical protein